MSEPEHGDDCDCADCEGERIEQQEADDAELLHEDCSCPMCMGDPEDEW